ncbi:hypothetical protein JCM10212_006096 [Sporobolomyces blumeae]
MTEQAATSSRGRGGSRGGRGRGGGGGGRGRGGKRAQVNPAPLAPGGIPSGSVSKIKAQLRQTKRLLAKDDLNPDVRITSERRLAALEDELVKAEKGLLEKKMVTKYRGVKFFERQKVLRRIKQAKKAAEGGDESAKSQLYDARMDLHYILRYPKTEKYLALYPSNTYIPYTATPIALSSLLSTSISVPSSEFTPSDPSTSKSQSTSSGELAESDLKRHKLRTGVRTKVESGEWPVEAERGDLGIEGEEDVAADGSAVAGEKRSRVDEDEGADETGDGDGQPEKAEIQANDDAQEDETTPAKKRKVEEPETAAVAGDAKPLNRKQKKALRRAQEAAQEATAGELVALTTTTVSAAEKDNEEKEEDGRDAAEAGPDGEPKKLNRKQKKALKRAQEAAAEGGPVPRATSTTTMAKGQNGAAADKAKAKGKANAVGELNKAEKLAQEDDFFA